MAQAKNEIQNSYPLPTYNYQVSIDGNNMSFSEISGLTIEYEQITYRDGFSWLMGDHLIRGRRNPIHLTLKRGIVRNRSQLTEWLDDGTKKDIKIDLCDEGGLPLVSWKVSRALAVKMESPSFSASTNDVALESLELIAHRLKIVYEDKSALSYLKSIGQNLISQVNPF